jgi:hypothetical protein
VGRKTTPVKDQILHMGWERTQEHSLKFDAAIEGVKIRNWIDLWFAAFWVRLPTE